MLWGERGLGMRFGGKQKKMRLTTLTLRAGLVVLFAYLAATLISTQVQIVSRRQVLDEITQEVQVQQSTNKELQRTLDSGDENAYIERVAREKLGFALPDERVFVDMSGK